MKVTTIILIRHGETAWNREHLFRGLKDIPLNDSGREQARKTAEVLRPLPVKAVYSSPLARALETAGTIARVKGLTPIVEPPFNDLSFGSWEGRLVEEVARESPAEFKKWRESPHLWKAPGGDSLHQVKERAWLRLKELAGRHEGETMVIVSHRVVLKLLLIAALELKESKFWLLEQSPCAINVLSKKGKDYYLNKFNESCHLITLPEAIYRGDH